MGFETFKNIIEFNKTQKDGDEEDIENDICPYCAWTLDVNEKGVKSCSICGRLYLGTRLVASRD